MTGPSKTKCVPEIKFLGGVITKFNSNVTINYTIIIKKTG